MVTTRVAFDLRHSRVCVLTMAAPLLPVSITALADYVPGTPGPIVVEVGG